MDEQELEFVARDEATPTRTCFVGGHFPHLRFRVPGPTRGYRPASKRLDAARVRPVNLVGRRFTYLIVESICGDNGSGGTSWNCRCVAPTGPNGAECSRLRARVKTYDLLSGQLQSCGCAGKLLRAIRASAEVVR